MTSWSMSLAASVGVVLLWTACRGRAEPPVPTLCTPCSKSSDCSEDTLCDTTDRVCRAADVCCSDSDCPTNKACNLVILSCVEGPSCDEGCAVTETCDVNKNICVQDTPCATDVDCAPLKTCDTTTGFCE